MKPSFVYLLLAVALLLFLAFSSKPDHPQPSVHRRLITHLPKPLRGRSISFDPFDDMDDEFEFNRLTNISREFDFAMDLKEFVEQWNKLNVSARLGYLFPYIDVDPVDGFVSMEELEKWNVDMAVDRLDSRTDKELKAKDFNGDELVTLAEFLSHPSNEDIGQDIEDTAYGHAGWWKEFFANADADADGALNRTELNDFLHPEDSTNEKVNLWFCQSKLKHLDTEDDGKVSFEEFLNRGYDLYKAYSEFEGGLPTARETFDILDISKDGYLTAGELKPIIEKLYPGEISYAKFYTKYLMREADDNEDGTLSLKEMLDHASTFYSIVHQDELDVDYDSFFHDELRR